MYMFSNFMMSICLFMFAFAIYSESRSMLLMIILIFYLFQGTGQGPLFYIYLSELCTPKCFGLAVAINSFGGILISLVTPFLLLNYTIETFIFFAFVTFGVVIVCYFFMPETKLPQKKNEEIELL